MAKLVVFKKGGGGKVAVNPDQVTHVRSAAGAFTDIFFNGHQVAVEGTFDEILNALTAHERRAQQQGPSAPGDAQRGLVFNRLTR